MRKPWVVLRLPIYSFFSATDQPTFSTRIDRRVPGVFLGLLVVLGLTLIMNLSLGEYPIPLINVIKALLGLNSASTNDAFIITSLRLPRSLVAILVGMALAIAGTILQGLTRNPLAAPEIIGINAGASLAAVTWLIFLPTSPLWMLAIAAFTGACLAMLAVERLSWGAEGVAVRFILIGVGLTELMNALTRLMLTFGDINSISQVFVWLSGSVYGRGWPHVWLISPWLLLFLPLTVLLARDLNTLALSDDLAYGLGSSVQQQRRLLLLASVALAGSAVATAGTISFVGLMAPHLARQLVGASHEGLIPIAALMGGCIVLLADLAGRYLFAPMELPCGVITAAIGAPYFLYLLYRNRHL